MLDDMRTFLTILSSLTASPLVWSSLGVYDPPKTMWGAGDEASTHLADDHEIMIISHSISDPVNVPTRWEDLWEGADQGLICSWARGLEKAQQDSALAAQALRGELPPLAWKGGGDKAIKLGMRFGSLHYLATWQGLRGQDLYIDTDLETHLTCAKTGTTVIFTTDLQALARSAQPDGAEA